MARNTKKKLAIFAGTSKCLVYAEAKYCASEMPGEIKYYECSRSEYCCAFGCCVSPGLHFHHLWYYWILVIIMFLVCSGGGWWYRYWLQGRYRAAASAIPNRSSSSRAQNALRGPTCQAQRARISYNAARNTVLLHRMWKGPQRNGAAPAYNGNATTSTHYQHMNVVLNDANCPYYQLYGPPPSYETVIAQSRGKLSNPGSPESSGSRSNLQPTPNIITNPSVAPCFSYACSPSLRIDSVPEPAPQYQSEPPRELDGHESLPYYTQYCGINAVGPKVCVPYEYQEQSLLPPEAYSCQGTSRTYLPCPVEKLSDTSDLESYEASCTERYAMLNIDQGPSGSGEPPHWRSGDDTISRVHRSSGLPVAGTSEAARKEEENEDIADTPINVDKKQRNKDDALSRILHAEFKSQGSFANQEEFLIERRTYGGSLKLDGRHTGKIKSQGRSVDGVSLANVPRSCDGIATYEESSIISSNTSNNNDPNMVVNAIGSPYESNPSSNVILESCVPDDPSVSSNQADDSRSTSASTNSNHESKTRLDRSKSLD